MTKIICDICKADIDVCTGYKVNIEPMSELRFHVEGVGDYDLCPNCERRLRSILIDPQAFYGEEKCQN